MTFTLNGGLTSINPDERLYYLLFVELVNGSGIYTCYIMVLKISNNLTRNLMLGMFNLEIKNFAGIYKIKHY